MTVTLTNSYKKEVVRWILRKSHSSVPTVGLLSPLALRNKSSFKLKAILTSPSVVRHAARQGNQSVTETVATAKGRPGAKCSPRYVPSVVKKPKYRSSRARVDRCIVASATISKDQTNNLSLALRT